MTSPTASSSSATRAARKRCTRDGCRKLARPGRKRCDDHKPGAPGNPAKRPGGTRRPPRRPRLLGHTEPRICSAQPRRPLTRKTTRGYEVIDFAEMAGEPLLPWQQWAAKRALELNPDGTYRFRVVIILVARQNGKSHLKRMISLWRLYMDGARRIVGAAQDLSLARDQWQMCQDTIHNCPDLEAEWGSVRNVNGDEYFWLANGARYAIKATNRKAGRGGSNDEVNIDELREQRDWAAWGALSKTTNARARAQIWLMSNAGDDESVVLNQLCDKAIAGGDDDGGEILLLEWSAPKGCELDDTDAWCCANPGLGYIVSEAAIRLALNDPPEVFRTEVLCQRVEKLDWAIDPGAWRDGADPSGTMDGLRGRLAAVFDAAPDGQHFTLGVGAKRSDGRIRTEIVQAWTSTAAVRAELPGLLARVRPRAFCWFPSGPAAELGTVLRPLALKYNFRPGTRQASDVPLDGELKGVKVTEVCQEFAGLVRARAVVHADQDLLNDHVFGASKLWTGDGWRFMRKGAGHCDAAYVAAGCVCTALVLPERKVAKIRVLA